MNPSSRPLVDELLDWIDREIERAESGAPKDESASRASDPDREPEPRERLKVPSSIPA